MGALFRDEGQLARLKPLPKVRKTPQDIRRRAEECRELAGTCLTPEAEQVLRELAFDLDREASQLELS